SSTSTFTPKRPSTSAAASPAIPPPTTATSTRLSAIGDDLHALAHLGQAGASVRQPVHGHPALLAGPHPAEAAPDGFGRVLERAPQCPDAAGQQRRKQRLPAVGRHRSPVYPDRHSPSTPPAFDS